jgi:hypothetical protein
MSPLTFSTQQNKTKPGLLYITFSVSQNPNSSNKKCTDQQLAVVTAFSLEGLEQQNQGPTKLSLLPFVSTRFEMDSRHENHQL